MTVLYPHTTDITYNNISLSEDIKCLPELVNDKEYKTAYMGKMAFGDEVFAQHGDNGAVLALINSFNDSSAVGKMQYGPPWWFLDHKEGIEAQLNDLSVYGVLGNFIGMLTDSRSFLSFPRHEYFRRILCNTLGKDVEEGLIPDDRSLLKSIIENICYYNVKRYLGIK